MKGKHENSCFTDLGVRSCKCHTCAKDGNGCNCVDKFDLGSCFVKDCPDFTPEIEENWYEAMSTEEKQKYNAASNWGCF